MRQQLGLSLDVLVALLACSSCPAVCCKHGAQAPQEPRQGGRTQQQEEFRSELCLRSIPHRSHRPQRQQPGAAPCPRSRGVAWGVGGFPAEPLAAPQRLGQTRPASPPAPPSPALRTEQTLLRMAAWGLGVRAFRAPNLNPRWGCSRAIACRPHTIPFSGFHRQWQSQSGLPGTACCRLAFSQELSHASPGRVQHVGLVFQGTDKIH